MADDSFVGPVNAVIFAFPPGAAVGEGLRALYAEVTAGTIEVLDVEFLRLADDGHLIPLSAAEVRNPDGFDTSVFEGASSEILDDDDYVLVAQELEPGGLAVVVVYEDRALATAATNWVAAGGQELFSGGVDMEELADIVEEED